MKTTFILGFWLFSAIYPSITVAQNLTVCQENDIITDNLDLTELQDEVDDLGIDFVGCGTLCEPINGDCSHCVSLVLDDALGVCLELEAINIANTTNVTDVCCQEIVEGASSFCGIPSFLIIADTLVEFNSECSLESTNQPTDNPTKSPSKTPTKNPVEAPINDDVDDDTPPPTLPPFDSSASALTVSIALFFIPFLLLRYL